jgi:glutamine synthetase adenylyltransferase
LVELRNQADAVADAAIAAAVAERDRDELEHARQTTVVALGRAGSAGSIDT